VRDPFSGALDRPGAALGRRLQIRRRRRLNCRSAGHRSAKHRLAKHRRRCARIIKLVQQKSAPGAIELGSCLTDATRGGSRPANRPCVCRYAAIRTIATSVSNRVHRKFGPRSWIVKQQIGAVPRKIFVQLAAGTGTFLPDEISPRSTRRTRRAPKDANLAPL
jgi:hypothetical protein